MLSVTAHKRQHQSEHLRRKPHAPEGYPANLRIGLPRKRGVSGGKPPVSEGAPFAPEVEPADCPLSILFGYFLSWERKYRPAGTALEGGVVTLRSGQGAWSLLCASALSRSRWAHGRVDNACDCGQTRCRLRRPLGFAHPLRPYLPYAPTLALRRCHARIGRITPRLPFVSGQIRRAPPAWVLPLAPVHPGLCGYPRASNSSSSVFQYSWSRPAYRSPSPGSCRCRGPRRKWRRRPHRSRCPCGTR